MTETQKSVGDIETWAIVEIFGHKKLAGFVRSVPMGGAMMLRIDVPELPAETEKYFETDWSQRDPESQDGGYKRIERTREIAAVPAFTQFLGVASIFSLTPCTEEAARYMLKKLRASPHVVLQSPARLLPAPDREDIDDEG